jgi:ankyrin repeat protein
MDRLLSRLDITARGWYQTSPLHWAAKRGWMEVANVLMSDCPEIVTMQDYSGESALHYAVQHQHLEVVMAILHKQPNAISVRNGNGETALDVAFMHGNMEALKALLSKPVSPPTLDLISSLLRNWPEIPWGRHHYHRDRARPLLGTMFDANPEWITNGDGIGSTLLRKWIDLRETVLTEKLIRTKPSLLSQEIDGKTVLLVMVEGETLAEVKAGCDAFRGRDGVLATESVHRKTEEDLVRMIRTALDNGANPDATDNNGLSVLHAAARVGDPIVVKELLSRRPDLLHLEDKNSRTALKFAWNLPVIELLQ